MNVQIWIDGGALSAFGGAFIGGVFVIIGGWLVHHWQQKARKEKERETFRNVLKAFKQERATLWENYENIIGSEIESIKEGEYLDRQYVMTQEYFTVYKNNIPMLSRLDNEGLQELIVKTYLSACHLMDAIKANNDALEKLMKYFVFNIHHPSPYYSDFIELIRNGLIEDAKDLKNRHEIVKDLIKRVLLQFEQTIHSLK